MNLTTILGVFLILHSTISVPLKRSISNGNYNQITPTKKDMFLSRGWGAGGMPFSVLYMSPHSSKSNIEHNFKPIALASRQKELYKPKVSPISLRNSMGSGVSRMGLGTRKSYSIIPQLFVSYGWGPSGK